MRLVWYTYNSTSRLHYGSLNERLYQKSCSNEFCCQAQRSLRILCKFGHVCVVGKDYEALDTVRIEQIRWRCTPCCVLLLTSCQTRLCSRCPCRSEPEHRSPEPSPSSPGPEFQFAYSKVHTNTILWHECPNHANCMPSCHAAHLDRAEITLKSSGLEGSRS